MAGVVNMSSLHICKTKNLWGLPGWIIPIGDFVFLSFSETYHDAVSISVEAVALKSKL